MTIVLRIGEQHLLQVYGGAGGNATMFLMAFSDYFRPSRRAARLFLVAAKGGFSGAIARTLLITLHSSDVSKGAHFDGVPLLPHPVGIVVGAGTSFGRGVTIYQNVTIGSDARGGYPRIEQNVKLYAGCTVVGSITIGENAIIGATALVVRDVSSRGVVRGHASFEMTNAKPVEGKSNSSDV